MANYDRLRDDFVNLASILQDFNHRLQKLEQAIANLPPPLPPERDEPVLPVGSMTVQTFLKATGMGKSTFYLYAQQGKIDVRKFGHRNYILNTELERWLRDLRPRK